jgi:hypothetical protein
MTSRKAPRDKAFTEVHAKGARLRPVPSSAHASKARKNSRRRKDRGCPAREVSLPLADVP